MSFILWIKRNDLETLFFFLSEKDKSWLKKSCGLGFQPPWGFYTLTCFSTCCTTVGQGDIFILFQFKAPLLARRYICF